MRNVYYYYTVVVLVGLRIDLGMRASLVCHVLGVVPLLFFCRFVYLSSPCPETPTNEDYLLRVSFLIDRVYIVRSVARSAKSHVAVGRASVRDYR